MHYHSPRFRRSVQIGITTAQTATLITALLISTRGIQADDPQAETATAQSPATLTVTGAARDALYGQPIEGATVTISKLSKPRGRNQLSPAQLGELVSRAQNVSPAQQSSLINLEADFLAQSSAAIPEEPEALATLKAVTDSNGKFTFSLPTDHPFYSRFLDASGNAIAEENQNGMIPLEISIKHPNYPTAQIASLVQLRRPLSSRNLEEGFSRARNPDELVRVLEPIDLLPGKEVTAVLLAPDGTPLPDVRVIAYSQVPKNERTSSQNTANAGRGSIQQLATRSRLQFTATDETQTDRLGRFRVVMITPGEGLLAIYPETGFAPVVKPLFDRRGDLGAIELKSGPEISGRVIDHAGKPVPNFYINIEPWIPLDPLYSDLSIVQQPTRIAKTDADGHFSAAPLAPGEYCVELKNALRDPLSSPRIYQTIPELFVPQKLTINDGQSPAPIELRPAQTIAITGRFVRDDPPNNNRQQNNFPQIVSRFGTRTGPMIEGTIAGLDYRAWIRDIATDGAFKLVVPSGLNNATIDLNPLSTSLQPQWRLGNGPLQTSSKFISEILKKTWTISRLSIQLSPAASVSAAVRLLSALANRISKVLTGMNHRPNVKTAPTTEIRSYFKT